MAATKGAAPTVDTMAISGFAICVPAGAGLRMMRDTWRKLAPPAPTYKNNQARKVFKLFIPGLDKKVDMASNLIKAMFDAKPSPQSIATAKAQVMVHVELATGQRGIMTTYTTGDHAQKQFMKARATSTRRATSREDFNDSSSNNFIEYMHPNKQNSPLQKHYQADKGQQPLATSLMEEIGGNVTRQELSRRHGND